MCVCFSPPEHNPFYTSIDSMPEIKPRRKSIPLVSDLVSLPVNCNIYILIHLVNRHTMVMRFALEV